MVKIKNNKQKPITVIQKNTKSFQVEIKDQIEKPCASQTFNGEMRRRKCVVKVRRLDLCKDNVTESNGKEASECTVLIQQQYNAPPKTTTERNTKQKQNLPEKFNENSFTNKSNIKQRSENILCNLKDLNYKQITKPALVTPLEPILDDEKRKKFKKLSLTKNTNAFETPVIGKDKDLSRFEPIRNSTIYDLGLEENRKDKSTSSDKHSNSTKNFTNKSYLIEEILMPADDDFVDTNNIKDNRNEATNVNKTNKFFHRNNLVNQSKQNEQKFTRNRSKSKVKRATSERKTNVYEFLSNSQTSGSDSCKSKDPTADVIQKLIDAGKVSVATRRKGAGKPVIKRKAKVVKNTENRIKKPKTVIKKKIKQITKVKQNDNINENNEPQAVGISDDIDDFDELPMQPSSPVYDLEHNNNDVLEHTNEEPRQNTEHQTEGTFSNLARSVLMQETEKRKRQRQLLEQARKIISTPVNRKTTGTTPQVIGTLQLTNLSPIQPLAARADSVKTKEQAWNSSMSPWRVPDDSHLPSVFHFSRGTSNLPSFSSDYIPPTPQKSKGYVNKYAALGETSATSQNNNDLLTEATTSHILSSFSSNDSNAENLPPVQKAQNNPSTSTNVSQNENENIFNAKQLPNPRRTLQYRSPLKPINILEVVVLPTWKENPEINKKADKINQTAANHAETNTSQQFLNKSHHKSDENLFGFEDYIAEDYSPKKGTTNIKKNTTLHSSKNKTALNNITMRDKLKGLRKWRPNNVELKQSNPKKAVGSIFDEPVLRSKQRKIKEMLCSTMINPTKPSLETQRTEHCTNITDYSMSSEQLFKDPDPELTFDEKNPHRTYVRPYKRRRKLRHNFVMFMDSDISDDDDDDDENEDGNNDKLTSDKNAITANNKKKKPRKETSTKPNPELKDFVKDFNKMCKEVENYQLIVEKSG